MIRLSQNQHQSVKSLAFAQIFHITIARYARYARNGRNVKIVQTVKNSIVDKQNVEHF